MQSILKTAAKIYQESREQQTEIFMCFSKMMEDIFCGVSADRGYDDFNNREDLYRTRRDDFRDNKIAMNELAHWKAFDNQMDYKFL